MDLGMMLETIAAPVNDPTSFNAYINDCIKPVSIWLVMFFFI